MGEPDLLDGQQELFQVKHTARNGIPRCGDCGRFLKAGCPCMNSRCYGEGKYAHIPANAIRAAAAARRCIWEPRSEGHPTGDGCEKCLDAAALALAAAWPHILSTINPPKD